MITLHSRMEVERQPVDFWAQESKPCRRSPVMRSVKIMKEKGAEVGEVSSVVVTYALRFSLTAPPGISSLVVLWGL